MSTDNCHLLCNQSLEEKKDMKKRLCKKREGGKMPGIADGEKYLLDVNLVKASIILS